MSFDLLLSTLLSWLYDFTLGSRFHTDDLFFVYLQCAKKMKVVEKVLDIFVWCWSLEFSCISLRCWFGIIVEFDLVFMLYALLLLGECICWFLDTVSTMIFILSLKVLFLVSYVIDISNSDKHESSWFINDLMKFVHWLVHKWPNEICSKIKTDVLMNYHLLLPYPCHY